MDSPDASSAELLNTNLERLKKALCILVIVVIFISVTFGVVFAWRMNEVYGIIRRGKGLHTALHMLKTMESIQLVALMCLLFSLILALGAIRISKSRHSTEKRYGDASTAVLTSIVSSSWVSLWFIIFLVYRHHSHVALRDCRSHLIISCCEL